MGETPCNGLYLLLESVVALALDYCLISPADPPCAPPTRFLVMLHRSQSPSACLLKSPETYRFSSESQQPSQIPNRFLRRTTRKIPPPHPLGSVSLRSLSNPTTVLTPLGLDLPLEKQSQHLFDYVIWPANIHLLFAFHFPSKQVFPPIPALIKFSFEEECGLLASRRAFAFGWI